MFKREKENRFDSTLLLFFSFGLKIEWIIVMCFVIPFVGASTAFQCSTLSMERLMRKPNTQEVWIQNEDIAHTQCAIGIEHASSNKRNDSCLENCRSKNNVIVVQISWIEFVAVLVYSFLCSFLSQPLQKKSWLMYVQKIWT